MVFIIMIISILTALTGFIHIGNFAEIPTLQITKKELHSSSRKINSNNYNFFSKPKSRENFNKYRPKKIITPWQGHFSAKNFRKNKTDNLYLKKVKENLRTSIISLPKWHTQALKDLEIKKIKNISRGLSNNSKMILHISSIQTTEELTSVFIHEMGHITDLGVLKGKNGHKTNFYDGKIPILNDDLSFIFYKISWKNSHQKRKSAKRADFVSGYAQNDCFEDFAETYLLYRLHGEKFRGILKNSAILEKKYNFMKKYVFENQEFQLDKLPNPSYEYQTIFDTTLLSFNQKDL